MLAIIDTHQSAPDPGSHTSDCPSTVCYHPTMGVRDIFFRNSGSGRYHPKDSFWNGKKKGFTIAATSSFIFLQCLYLGNLSYLAGSIYKNADRTHNLNVLMVDYDQGVIGQSMIDAYASLKADDFPTLIQKNISEYATPADIVHAVHVGDYWAGVYTHSGASDRLAAALQGGTAATSYNSSNTLTWVVNGVRYPTVAEGYLESNIATLGAVTRVVYNTINGTQAARIVSIDASAIQALLDPITLTEIDTANFNQSDRVLYSK